MFIGDIRKDMKSTEVFVIYRYGISHLINTEHITIGRSNGRRVSIGYYPISVPDRISKLPETSGLK